MTNNNNNIVEVDFTFRPDADHRNQMVDVLKNYLMTAHNEGFIPSSLNIEIVFTALEQAVEELHWRVPTRLGGFQSNPSQMD